MDNLKNFEQRLAKEAELFKLQEQERLELERKRINALAEAFKS